MCFLFFFETYERFLTHSTNTSCLVHLCLAMAAATATAARIVMDKKEAPAARVPREQKIAAKDAKALLIALSLPLHCHVYGIDFITGLYIYADKDVIEIKPKMTNVNQKPICCVYDAKSQLVPSYIRQVMWHSPGLLLCIASTKRLYPAISENGVIQLTTWDYQIAT